MFTEREINKAISKHPWDLANKTLYDLCSKHPNHKNNEEIIAKVWIIGRTYAAAIERRKEVVLRGRAHVDRARFGAKSRHFPNGA